MGDQQTHEELENEIMEWIRHATPEQLELLKEKLNARRNGLKPDSSD